MIPSRRQVRLLLPLGAAVALSLTGDSTLYAVLANQKDVLGISLGAVGILLGVNRMIRILGNPLAGAWYDRLGRRWLFLLGLVLGIISTFSYSLVRGFWPLFGARLLWGIAWALINVGGYTMVLDWSTPTDRGRMTGFYQVSYMVGLSISPIVGGALTDALGFRSAVRICAILSSIGLAVAFVALPETRPSTRGSAGEGQGARWSLRGVVRALRQADRQILLAGYIYLVILFVGNGVMMSTIGLYLEQRWGTTMSLAGWTFGVASLAGGMLALRASLGILAGPAAGTLSDHLGDRWPVARAGLLLGMVGFLVLAFVTQLWAVPIGVSLVSLTVGALTAVLSALVGDVAVGNRQGSTIGALAAAGDLGSATGPLLAFAVAGTVDLRWVYLFCAVALVTGLLAIVGMGVDTRCH